VIAYIYDFRLKSCSRFIYPLHAYCMSLQTHACIRRFRPSHN
jgi:hypothetical protein